MLTGNFPRARLPVRYRLWGIQFGREGGCLARFALRGAFGNPAVSVSPADKAIERGSAAATKEDRDPAITEFTEAVGVDPEFAEGYCGLGMLRREARSGQSHCKPE